MVHVTATTAHQHYDIEKPGYQGYDRRHYPEKHRFTLSETIFKPRGRAHVPSPPLEEQRWRPHGQYIEPRYSNVGPDWQSRLRYIASPSHPDAKPTLPVAFIERNVHFMRPFPQNWQRSSTDWNYFPDENVQHRSSKRNHFADIYLRSIEDLGDENVSMAQIGHKRQVYDNRNGLDKRSDGDKSYRTVEYSTDFYKFGSTLPAVNFGREKKFYGHERTIVPMKTERVTVLDEAAFEKKERQFEQDQLIEEVIQLENWKPAESITSAFKVLDRESTDKNAGRYRPRVR